MRVLLTFFWLIALPAIAQQPSLKQVDLADDHLALEIPAKWSFEGSVIVNEQGKKIGELSPGIKKECAYKNGTAFIVALKKGFEEDPEGIRFINSKKLVINGRAWTEGVCLIDCTDGNGNWSSWYAHRFFSIMDGNCFEITFYSQGKSLKSEQTIKQILGSIKIVNYSK